jgi:hypothetical protein
MNMKLSLFESTAHNQPKDIHKRPEYNVKGSNIFTETVPAIVCGSGCSIKKPHLCEVLIARFTFSEKIYRQHYEVAVPEIY